MSSISPRYAVRCGRKLKAEGNYLHVDSEAVASSIYLQTFGFWLFYSLGGGGAALPAQVERSMAFLLATAFPRHFWRRAQRLRAVRGPALLVRS